MPEPGAPVTATEVFDHLAAGFADPSKSGTLHALQRAVLLKARSSHDRAGHFPILDVPLGLLAHHGAPRRDAIALAEACLLFYGFADVVDDAQDHDLTADPWEAWGWEQAVNTGCSLLFASQLQLAEHFSGTLGRDLLVLFARAGSQMTEGQHRDLAGVAQASDLAGYLQTIERKSGASMGAYCEAAARVVGLESAAAPSYFELGQQVGMLCQMVNDTHELWSSALSPDFANRRMSLPLLLGLEQAQGEARERLQEALEAPADLAAQRTLVQCLEGLGIKSYATLRIEVTRRAASQKARELGLEGVPALARLLEVPAFPAHDLVI